MVRWIIQNNDISDIDLQRLIDACKNLNIKFELIKSRAFSKELPKFSIDNDITNIYYGGTTLMYNIYTQFNRPIGLFFNDNFSMENYINKWGPHMLSSEAKILTIQELLNHETTSSEEQFFIRPDADDKSFVGQVKTLNEIKTIMLGAVKYDNNLTLESKVLFGPAYSIKKEWRNFVVDGKVITSSLYQENFRLKKSSEDIPESMIKFVEDRCKEYTPHSIFVMDIALCGGDYYIIECGCLNSTGLYHTNVEKIVKAVSEFIDVRY